MANDDFFEEVVAENDALRGALRQLYDATGPLDREWVYDRLNEAEGDAFDEARQTAAGLLTEEPRDA